MGMDHASLHMVDTSNPPAQEVASVMATDTRRITIVMFSDKEDNQPKTSTVSWDKLAERLTRHAERDNKDGPLFSPVTYAPGATRGNGGVTTINLAVGDFDHGEDWATVKEQLQVYQYVAYSTHSFTPEDCRFRVVIPLSAPVPKADWQGMKARIDYHVFRQGADPVAKDPARLYYLPSCPPGGLRFAEHHDGKWLDPFSLPSAPNSRPLPPDGDGSEHAEVADGIFMPLGKTALDFVANGAPIREQRSRALAAARNYLSAGYSVEDTAAAIWRGLQACTQEDGREPWTRDDAYAIARNLKDSETPPIEFIDCPVPPRSEIQRTGLGYLVTFPSIGLTIGIDHLHRKSDGLKGEIEVIARLPGVPYNLHNGIFNLSSGTARTSLNKYLTRRADGSALTDKAWEGILEDFCRKVVQTEREGEPSMLVGGLPEDDSPPWLVENIILNNELGTIYGPGSTGKSRFVLALGLSVKTGEEFIPGFKPNETGEVGYLDWETGWPQINKRINQLCRGKECDYVNIRYQHCRAPMTDIYEQVIKMVKTYSIKLLILDSVEAATAGTRDMGADQNSAVMMLYQCLRLLNTPVVLIDHVNSVQAKETKGVRKPYGSVFKYNYARYAFELRQATETKIAGDEHLALYCTKYNDGMLPIPQGLRVRFTDATTIYSGESISSPDLTDGMPQAEQILAVLGDSELSVKEISAATSLKENKIRAVISAQAPLFVRIGEGHKVRWKRKTPF